MKAALFVLLLALASCSKTSNEVADTNETKYSAEITGVSWKEVYSGPSVPSIKWTFTLKTKAPEKITSIVLYNWNLRKVAAIIEHPEVGEQFVYQAGHALPRWQDKWYFYFDIEFTDGYIKTLDKFPVP